MKTNRVLLVLQFAVLAVLAYKVMLVDQRLDDMSFRAADPPAGVTPQSQETAVTSSRGDPTLDERALRRIIRSELMAFSDSMKAAMQDDPGQEPEIDPVENANRLEVVKQDLSYYIEQGEISDIEMQQLQYQIAQLDSENRTLMMRELVRALGSGELQGRF